MHSIRIIEPEGKQLDEKFPFPELFWEMGIYHRIVFPLIVPHIVFEIGSSQPDIGRTIYDYRNMHSPVKYVSKNLIL